MEVAAHDHGTLTDTALDFQRPADHDHTVQDFFVGRDRDVLADGDAGPGQAIGGRRARGIGWQGCLGR
jgi:hypothetical protein